LTGLPAENAEDLGHSAYDMTAFGFRGIVDQRPRLMSITIPKRVRVLNGITDPLGGSRENLLGGRYEINQIGRPSGIENWLPM
jgi:hypothetical protein